MQKWLEKLKTEKKDQILILLLLGVLLLVIAIPTEEETAKAPEQVAEESEYSVQLTKEQMLEEKLKQILQQVEGIGKTEVMITLKSQGKKMVEKDVEHSEGKEENGQDGNSQISVQISDSESTVYKKDAQGNEIPYITEELEPEIEGVLVIAQGAGNPAAAAEITEAVMALFGVEAHKIKVMKME